MNFEEFWDWLRKEFGTTKERETIRGYTYTILFNPNFLIFTPQSTRKSRTLDKGWLKVHFERFMKNYKAGRILKPGDYHDNSFNPSYFIPLIKEYLKIN